MNQFRIVVLLTLLNILPSSVFCLSGQSFKPAKVPAKRVIDIDAVVAAFEPEIKQAMEAGNIPSCAVALISDDEVIWKSAYGHSNVWAKTPATTDTVYLIGSTFKTMSAAALLQQMESGAFELDEPVNKYLQDLDIEGEDADAPITFRHLLSHTSSLAADFGPHPVWGETVPLRLHDYLSANLQVAKPPCSEVVYSNRAFTLVAYLVEQMAEQPYRKYIKDHIFEPLEMNSTAFRPTPQMQEKLAVPYIYINNTKMHVPAERLHANVWPAGIVYGTVEDQANWMIAMLNEGRFKGETVLQPESIRESFEVQFSQFAGNMPKGWGNETAGFGLAWWCCTKDDQRYFAHSGSVPGYTAFLQGNADEKLGFAILTNGNRSHEHLIRLADESIRLMKAHQVTE